MKILTPEQIREIDLRAIRDFKIPALSLMQKAGEAVADAAEALLKTRGLKGPVGIVTGKGNNGGDGFTAACVLAERGIPSHILMLFREKDLSKDARHFHRKAKTRKAVRMHDCSSSALLRNNIPVLKDCGVVLDAILGTGFRGAPAGVIAEAIDAVNLFGKTVIAVDVPSGLDAATGKAEKAVMADCTVTMGFFKSGFLLGEAMNRLGTVRIADIGIPDKLRDAFPTRNHLLSPAMVGTVIPRRLRMTNKGSYGHVLIIAGSTGMSGAAILCARAALRSGSGLVTVACPKSIQATVAGNFPETMTRGMPENPDGTLAADAFPLIRDAVKNSQFDALVLGPGLGHNEQTQAFVFNVLNELDIPMVVDADALNAIAQAKFDLTRTQSRNIVLTPHIGEFARLTGKPKEVVKSELWGNVVDFCRINRCTVVLKSHISAISDGKSGEFINIAGNAGMATAGMGDVLSGVIGSFLGQGLSVLDAATAGSFVHASAGDVAANRKGWYSLLASDVIECLPQAIAEIPLRRQSEKA